MSDRVAEDERPRSAGTSIYIIEMMDELAVLSRNNGDTIGAMMVQECADVLRRRRSFEAAVGAAKADVEANLSRL